ncbi:addiction module protein [Reyranella sp. CPCC 100927]|uniref:addiction module protein n=1 Tax=Reyranella sp. CPCC 100927 TaxID=2599616 RepID=UPI0011B64329|nr:addiction module protein [Reyranella sp. CPCC 100927]TWT15757.1 addiction module protein [Reyranella sp. CPCC 100927]
MSMNASLRQEIAKLTLEERLELIDGIWDDVEVAQVVPDLTPEQEVLLEERYREHLRNPNAPRKTLKEIADKLGVSL